MKLLSKKIFLLLLLIVILIFNCTTLCFAEILPINSKYLSEINELTNDFSFNKIKKLSNFEGKTFDLIEGKEGYFIFDQETQCLLEGSPFAISPYKNLEYDLYYNGPLEYYYKSNSNFKSLFSNKNLSSLPFAFVENTPATYALNNSSTYVQYPQYFIDMKECGYVGGGICGYIALAISLTYNYIIGTPNWIQNPTYINESNYTHPTTSFVKYLREFGINRGFDAGSYSSQIRDVAKDYLNSLEYPITTEHISLWTPFFTKQTILNNLAKNHPVLLFGNFPDPGTDTNIGGHTVVCYGYEKTENNEYYVVHYGWTNYSNVYIKTNYAIGSIYSIWEN